MAARATALHPPGRAVAIDRPRFLGAVWSRRDVVSAVLLATCALALYLWRLDQPKTYVYDEVYHAYTAAQLAAGNADAHLWYTAPPDHDRVRRVDYEWSHPPLAKLLMQLGVISFGDTPFGWRFAGAIVGAAGVVILYIVGRVVFDQTVGLLAASLLLLDGLWFVQSRTAMNDIFVAVFVMLGYLIFYLYLSSTPSARHRFLWLLGVTFGLAIGTKWSALYSFGLIATIVLAREAWLFRYGRGENLPKTILVLAAALIVLPAGLYVESYAQFFLMGRTWSEWYELQGQMWRYHANLKACHDWSSPAWTWPFMLRPVWYYVGRYPDGTVANVFAMGNPLIWWACLSAIAVVVVQWLGGGLRTLGLGLIVLGFLGQWLPWLLSPRISFLYHMLPSVPFGCLAVAYVLGMMRNHRLIVGGYLALVLLAFGFYYPQYAALPVDAAYAKLHYWLPTWEPGSPWAFRCPPGNN